MKVQSLRPEFVDYIPRELAEGTLYVSKKFGTASHLCCCGCRTKIVTPLRETEYELTEREGAVSLYPSIGNWNHPCQAHYWIRDNRIIEAPAMTSSEIQRGRAYDDELKAAHFMQPNISWWTKLGTRLAQLLKRIFR